VQRFHCVLALGFGRAGCVQHLYNMARCPLVGIACLCIVTSDCCIIVQRIDCSLCMFQALLLDTVMHCASISISML
jgi:hypothetical protein